MVFTHSSFTAEEIYGVINNSEDSIHETKFVEIPKNLENKDLYKKWNNLFKIKQEANIAIEEKRSNKIIGSSLEAEIVITTGKSNYDLLEGLDLADYFITSKADKIKSEKIEELKIEVKKAKGSKCPRCWKILTSNCVRCTNAINES